MVWLWASNRAAEEARSSAVLGSRLLSDRSQAIRWLFPSTAVWREANDNTSQPGSNQRDSMGIYQDTDGEFGQTANYGYGWLTMAAGPRGHRHVGAGRWQLVCFVTGRGRR